MLNVTVYKLMEESGIMRTPFPLWHMSLQIEAANEKTLAQDKCVV